MVIGAFSPAAAQSPLGGTTPQNGTTPIWRQYTTTIPTDRELYGLYMLDAFEGWAVGGSNGSPVILHYQDGEWWDETPAGIPFTDLYAVHFVSPTLGWAVGDSGTILKYEMGMWAEDAVSAPIGVSLNSVRMLSASDGWAAGGNGTFYHYDGSTWSLYSSTSGINNRVVNSLVVLGSTNAWAVGGANQIMGVPALIARFDGSSWTAQTSLAPRSLNALVMPTLSSGWAVGAGGVTLRYDGSSWISQTNPLLNLSSPPELFAVFALPSGQAWAVGNLYPGGDAPTLMHWDNGLGAWLTDTVALVYSYGFPPALHSVHMVSDMEGWAVGSEGIILRYSVGTDLQPTPTATVSPTVTPTSVAPVATATATATTPPAATATATATASSTQLRR